MILKTSSFTIKIFFFSHIKRTARRHEKHPTASINFFQLTRFFDFLLYFVKFLHISLSIWESIGSSLEVVLRNCDFENHLCLLDLPSSSLTQWLLWRISHLSRARDMNEWKWENFPSSLSIFLSAFLDIFWFLSSKARLC